MRKKFVKSIFFLLALPPVSFYRFFTYFVLPKILRFFKDYIFLEKNIQEILGHKKGSRESLDFIKKNFLHFSSVFCDLIKGAFLRRKIKVSGGESFKKVIKKAEDQGEGGFILVTAHFGNWELLGDYAGRFSTNPFYALAKPSRSWFLNDFLELLRGALNIKVLWTGKQNFQRKLVKVLRKNESVGFLADQKPHKRLGVSVDFLGRETSFVKGPASLAKRYKKPVLMAFCLRKGPNHYDLISECLDYSMVLDLSVEELSQVFASKISERIRKNPEQWVWSYKRWNNLT